MTTVTVQKSMLDRIRAAHDRRRAAAKAMQSTTGLRGDPAFKAAATDYAQACKDQDRAVSELLTRTRDADHDNSNCADRPADPVLA